MLLKFIRISIAAVLLPLSFFNCARTPITSLDDAYLDSLPNESQCIQIKFKKQIAPNMCGAAALVSVLQNWNVNYSQLQIVSDYPSKSRTGYSMDELNHIAKSNGMYVVCLNSDKNFLREQIEKGRPVLVVLKVNRFPIFSELVSWWKKSSWNHAVVVCGVYGDSSWWVMNPQRGFRRMRFKRFEKMWSANNHACLLVARKEPE